MVEEVGKLGGYNAFLRTSLPDSLRAYNTSTETPMSSHQTFTTTFPRGFASEILQVYSGPPVIAYKFSHWAYMEGPFKGHVPTGEKVELYGISIVEVCFSPHPTPYTRTHNFSLNYLHENYRAFL